jgi:hypothetical protein
MPGSNNNYIYLFLLMFLLKMNFKRSRRITTKVVENYDNQNDYSKGRTGKTIFTTFIVNTTFVVD